MEILNWKTKEIIYETDVATIKELVGFAIENRISLRYADLRYADLSYANLSYADLSYADLRYADLRYADLRYANLCDTLFKKTKISFREKIVEVNFTKVK